MESVVYTQRVEVVEGYRERRDCADQNIPLFLRACGYLPIPVPNVLDCLPQFLDCVAPVGVLLTGGNSLERYGGAAPERDRTDFSLIELSLGRGMPIYGFCRGMQSILDYFGCGLEEVDGHVAVRHKVCGEWGEMEVNSYHNQGCRQVKAPLRAVEVGDDGVVEAIEDKAHRVVATMWHPERERPFAGADIRRVRELFGGMGE